MAKTPHTDLLTNVTSDTFVLAVKTHAAHWNLTGPSFQSLHLAFEAQYTALYIGADLLAERLRALGKQAPYGTKAILDKSSLNDGIPDTDGIVLARTLGRDHRAVAKACAEAAKASSDAGDEATADLLIGRVEEHEKTAWMLEATSTVK